MPLLLPWQPCKAHRNVLKIKELTFFLSLTGSFRALMTSAAAEGTTEHLACLFCTVSLTVTRRPLQSLAVSLAMSSPIFLGDRPRGPIFGAREEAAPTSPPVTRTNTSITSLGSNLGGCKHQAIRHGETSGTSHHRFSRKQKTASAALTILSVF